MEQNQATRILLGNCSPHRQIRWTTSVVPPPIATLIPESALVNGVLLVRGEDRLCGTSVYVLADLPGDSVAVLDVPEGLPTTVIPAGASKLVPSPEQLRLELRVANARAPFQLVSIHRPVQHRARLHMRAVVSGFVAEMWADIWAWQDVIDICGRITWSDRTNPGHWSPVMGDDVRIECAIGRLHLDFATRWGMPSGGYEIQPLSDSSYPDAMPMPFYGCWVPDLGPAPDREAAENAAYWHEVRSMTAQAAAGGPIVALAEPWEGSWFGGLIPPLATSAGTGLAEWRRFQARLAQPGRIHDARDLASPKATGSTGDQLPFGSAEYWLLRGGDPRRVWQLRESAVDYLLRCHHHCEPNGAPLTFAAHQKVRTWSLGLFRTGDLLGKSTETPGGSSHAFGRALLDDQHRGDAYIASLRHVTDDPLLEADLADRTEMDLARAKRHTNGIDSPRAAGRLFQSWAMGYWTTRSADIREKLHILSTWEFSLWEVHLATPTGNVPRVTLGQVRPAQAIGTDSRVIDGGPAWVPWQSAVMFCGLWHQIRLWRKHDVPLADRMLAYAMEIATTNLLYGVVRDVSGYLWPLNGVLWLPNGEANGPNYYTYPRPGASTGDDAWDMLVGTGGWFNTMGWPTLVAVYAQHGTNEQARKIATEILSRYSVRTPALCEWLAV